MATVKTLSSLFVLLLSLVLSMAANAQNKYQAMVFPLRASNADSQQNCTATLFKFNKCYLVTNAHCILKSHKLLSQTNEDQFVWSMFGKLDRSVDVKVVKVDPASDLALLSTPSSLKSECSKLPDIERERRYTFKEGVFASFGFHNGVAQEAFVAGKRWDVGDSTTLRAVSTSLRGVEKVLEVPRLEITFGMSGGALVSQSGTLYGINKSFVPFQGRTYVIPFRDVIRFVQSKNLGPQAASDSDGNTKRNGGENSGANGGENSGANGGENSGANGGENSGANGNGKIVINPDLATADRLAFLREPAEGVMIQTQQGMKRLLALGPYQIDGFDNYREHEKSNLIPVYFGEPQFLEAKAAIAKRFQGSFASGKNDMFSEDQKKYHWSDSTEKLIASLPRGHKELLEAAVELRMTFELLSESNFRITLYRRSYDLMNGNHGQREYFRQFSNPDYSDIKTFNGTVLPSGEVEVTSSSNRLQCKNENYLKLICSSQDPLIKEELSVSRESLDGPINFRHAQEKYDSSQNKVILYRYGKLWSVDAKK